MRTCWIIPGAEGYETAAFVNIDLLSLQNLGQGFAQGSESWRDGKQILAFADFADGRSDAITDRFSQLDLFCEEISDAAASLLRFLVARSV